MGFKNRALCLPISWKEGLRSEFFCIFHALFTKIWHCCRAQFTDMPLSQSWRYFELHKPCAVIIWKNFRSFQPLSPGNAGTKRCAASIFFHWLWKVESSQSSIWFYNISTTQIQGVKVLKEANFGPAFPKICAWKNQFLKLIAQNIVFRL